MKTPLAVNGACGRMGLRILQLLHEDKELALGAALDAPAHPCQGRDAGEVAGIGHLGVPVRSTLPDTGIDVVIDFSQPAGTMAVLPQCLQRRLPLVIATAGHRAADKRATAEVAQE